MDHPCVANQPKPTISPPFSDDVEIANFRPFPLLPRSSPYLPPPPSFEAQLVPSVRSGHYSSLPPLFLFNFTPPLRLVAPTKERVLRT